MDTEKIIAIIITIVASTGFWTFLGKVYDTYKAKESVDKKALLALLHNEIYSICEHHIKSGEISADEYENLEYLYTPYIALGGNGTCERLKKEVDKLNII